MKFIFIISLALVGLITWLIIIPNLLDKEEKLVRAQAHLEYTRFQGQALIIGAQGQSRLDTSVAIAAVTASLFPWFVIGVMSILLLVMVWLSKQQEKQRIIYLPPSYLPRREVWRELEQMQNINILPTRTKQ